MSIAIDRRAAGLALALGWLAMPAPAAEIPIRVTVGADGIEFMTNLPETTVAAKGNMVAQAPSAKLVSRHKAFGKSPEFPVDREQPADDTGSDSLLNGKSFTGED